jgi:phage tail sheath protein FI
LTTLSPGVLALENDNSFISQQPVTVGAALIGPTVKGPVEIPTIVTSYSAFQNKFGTTFLSASNVYTYFTSVAAFNYFNNGGQSLLVSRVVSGSYTPANTGTSGDSISGSAGASNPVLVLETIARGADQNSSSSLDASGSLLSGSADNLRYQISNWNTSSGTFDLLIRKGSDNNLDTSVLETWTNLTLDPFTPNYVSKVIGDQSQTFKTDGTSYYLQTTGSFAGGSRYVRVKQVTNTPGYFDNNGVAKTAYTASIPINASGSFGNALGTLGANAQYYDQITDGNRAQGIPSGSNNGQGYPDMLNLLANTDDYKYNILLMPGVINSLQTGLATQAISNAQNRGDNIYIADLVPYGSVLSAVGAQAASRNTSYAASYWPWVQVQDPDSGLNVWVPASTVIGGVYSYNDSVSEPWFAPAGINRGGLSQVIRAERRLSQTDRDTLYNGKINPIATFPGQGVVVYGQKTLQTRASALDRVNVRRLLIALKSYISQVANNLVFEQNTAATRNNFLAQVNPYLESVQQRQGLYAFKVIMDDTNNTPTVIDQNQMVGQIYLQPTKTAEFIYLDFNITPTGATFPA